MKKKGFASVQQVLNHCPLIQKLDLPLFAQCYAIHLSTLNDLVYF